MARPTKFTQERAKRIVDAIRGGIDAVVAAKAGGISQSTFYEWRKRGENGERPFAQFVAELEQAAAQAEAYAVALIYRAMQRDPRWAKWFLERKYPQRWGHRPLVAFEPEGPVEITLVWPEQAAGEDAQEGHR